MSVLNEFTDEQLANAIGLRLNGSRWHKIVDPDEIAIDREWLLGLARQIVTAEAVSAKGKKYEL